MCNYFTAVCAEPVVFVHIGGIPTENSVWKLLIPFQEQFPQITRNTHTDTVTMMTVVVVVIIMIIIYRYLFSKICY
jgi:hypothetical protein